MQRSTERILTTHTGSLPRPDHLLQLMLTKEQGKPMDASELAGSVRHAVAEVVKQQVAVGIDVREACAGRDDTAAAAVRHLGVGDRARITAVLHGLIGEGDGVRGGVAGTAADAGDRAFHAAIFYNDRGAVPEIAAKDLRRLRRYIVQRKGVLPVRNPVRVRGERRREGVAGFCRKLLVKLGVRRRARRHLRGLQ